MVPWFPGLRPELKMKKVTCECGTTAFWVAMDHPGPWRCFNCNLLMSFEGEGGAFEQQMEEATKVADPSDLLAVAGGSALDHQTA